MTFENTQVFNFEGALRGMRNPMNSWAMSDSEYSEVVDGERNCTTGYKLQKLGANDRRLAQNLIKAGSTHRKFLRQIMVCVDITGPLYWWKEFDTYKVGTVANSTSTMHKLASTPITLECFEFDNFEDFLDGSIKDFWTSQIITSLEALRQRYNETKDIRYWRELIRLLPESWLQTRTVTMTYENLLAICSKGQRRNHKLTEWSKDFIDWARCLPYADDFIFLDEQE